jgi:hypothetical protein
MVPRNRPWNFLSQKKENDPEVRCSMGAKLLNVFARRYFIYGVMLFLAVPKGGTDIRMVYNGTSSGMNVKVVGAFVCLTYHFWIDESVGSGNFHGRFWDWRNVFEFHFGREMSETGGRVLDTLRGKGWGCTRGQSAFSPVGKMSDGRDLPPLPNQASNLACQGADHGRV